MTPERHRQLAANASARVALAQATLDRLLDTIPNGQPVLYGHHSQRRHQRDLARMDGAMSTLVQAYHEAEAHELTAARIEARDTLTATVIDQDPDQYETGQRVTATFTNAGRTLTLTGTITGRTRNDWKIRAEHECNGWPPGHTFHIPTTYNRKHSPNNRITGTAPHGSQP